MQARGVVLALLLAASVVHRTDCLELPPNPFGIGLVSPGSDEQLSLANTLAGNGGKVLLIFPGINRQTTQADPSWTANLQSAITKYNLVPVVRLAAPWGQANIRDDSDDTEHLVYSTLARAYAIVVRDVMQAVPANTDVYFQIGNEPNLCDEWTCEGGGWLSMNQSATEYTHFLRDVIQAIRGIGNPHILLAAAPMAPGGTVSCQCCGAGGGCQFQAGATGLDFMWDMMSAIPGIYDQVDFLASHSYPAQAIGWGFFVPFDQAKPGLLYYRNESAFIGHPSIGVMITETGWTTQQGCKPSYDDEATYMVASYQLWISSNQLPLDFPLGARSGRTGNVGLGNNTGTGTIESTAGPTVLGVMPFELMDPSWEQQGFSWVLMSGQQLPEFTQVRQLRCSMGYTGGGC